MFDVMLYFHACQYDKYLSIKAIELNNHDFFFPPQRFSRPDIMVPILLVEADDICLEDCTATKFNKIFLGRQPHQGGKILQ